MSTITHWTADPTDIDERLRRNFNCRDSTRHIDISQESFAASLADAAEKSHLAGRIIINHSAVTPDGSQ